MAETTQTDRSPDDAKADAKAAISADATKVTLKLQDDGNWTITVITP